MWRAICATSRKQKFIKSVSTVKAGLIKFILIKNWMHKMLSYLHSIHKKLRTCNPHNHHIALQEWRTLLSLSSLRSKIQRLCENGDYQSMIVNDFKCYLQLLRSTYHFDEFCTMHKWTMQQITSLHQTWKSLKLDSHLQTHF